MVSPITSRARDYVRSRAESVMSYSCVAEHVEQPSFDEENLEATAGSRTVLYTGVCRVWEIRGAQSFNVGGEVDLDISTTQLSTPYDAPLLPKNTEVEITDTPTQDAALRGKRFQIQSSAKAGELRATRRYNVTAVN